MSGNLILNTSSPTNALQAASKGYVDNKITNSVPKVLYNGIIQAQKGVSKSVTISGLSNCKIIMGHFIILDFAVSSFTIFNNVGNYCIIDIEDLWILDKGRVAIDNRRGYSKIYIENNQYMLHRYILGIKETNLHGFQVDHKSINPYDNTKENLIITTIDGNLCNRKGKGYRFRNPSYLIQYNCYWEYISKHDSINKIKHPSIMNEQEAKEEVFKRKWLANYIRPQFKSYEEYLEFKSTCPIDDLDKHWIETKFPNINKIEIPKYEENKEE